MSNSASNTITRRNLATTFLGASAIGLGGTGVRASVLASPIANLALAEELTIDMSGPPDNLDPALARSTRDWSLIHSIYDSILDLNDSGVLTPLAAESFELVDDVTYRVVLRQERTFHDGTPVDSTSIKRSIEHVKHSEGPAAGAFNVIDEVELPDDRTALLRLTAPAPWLPSQLAVWMVLFPESAEGSFETAPVGSGPYRFVARTPGSDIALDRNPDYPIDSAKGQPLAERVRFRFVSGSTTRLADLATGQAHVIDSVAQDQTSAVESAGGESVEAPVLGVSFLRLVNDVAPFDNPTVRKALNHAIDVKAIGQLLVSERTNRLASIFPDERSIGFDPRLAPFAFDPELARSLLAEAGLGDGFDARLEFTGGGREDVMQAFAANLADVGVNISIDVTELAGFNGSWRSPDSAPIRFVTWRPVYDPHTLLSLMFAGDGPLSRYADPEADALISQGATETVPLARSEVYRRLGRYFQESPPAVFLWNLTAIYGVKGSGLTWTPRSDEYILPMNRKESS